MNYPGQNGISTQALETGQIVRVRTRSYLVEDISIETGCDDRTVVDLACIDDDAQGQELSVIWEQELDAKVIGDDAGEDIGAKGFDDPKFFASYLHTLRWNCVTATEARLFQSPFRAGIRIDPYQLEPLRKALLLPRVNLFIADDVGLGKTIEAGLIANELLLRRRVNSIVVSCPPSMLLQWKDELETRFGLVFEIMDRDFIQRIRQERGFGVNPWTTFPRFLVSHRLLIDEAYTGPLRDWLGTVKSSSLFILDEAHHAAPASGARYAIDSRFTRSIRDISNRFEHRLFLSATPHNGHSNSFSALLELLDPQRFTRGVKVVKSNLDSVMVRRLKEDIREIVGGFPKRNVVQVDIGSDLAPSDSAEIVLSRLLNKYREVRNARVEGETKRKQAQAALLVSGLQQRLLSSIEAFAKTLAVHRRTMDRLWAEEVVAAKATDKQLDLISGGVSSDDDRANLSEEELDALVDDQFEKVTGATAGDAQKANVTEEKRLLEEMGRVAERERGSPDAKVRKLVEWIRENMCPGTRLPGQSSPESGASWTDLRVIIFTEYEDTKRYLLNMLRGAIAGTELADHRIEVFHGPTSPQKREQIKRAFNTHPKKHPLRILIATDAAREGLNLQAHCHQLFHFDVPWNPSRLEQRNGRIDRKLQPAEEVFCHYFIYEQRPEDRILQVLIKKTDIIRRELGSLSAVLESRLATTLKVGIKHDEVDKMIAKIEAEDLEQEHKDRVEEELEATRLRQDELLEQIVLLERRRDDAEAWIGLDSDKLRNALSCSLEMLDSDALSAGDKPEGEPQRFSFPNLERRLGSDPTWADTLDTLRKPPDEGRRDFAWRREAPIRPVVFDAPAGIDDDVVQLHLSHRIVQRLLGRFRAQGFVHHDLSRACLSQSRDNIPRVVLLGRLSLYGQGAARLHEELLTVTARWAPPESRQGPLAAYARDAEKKTMELLEESLKPDAARTLSEDVRMRLEESIRQDVEELLPQLDVSGKEARADAENKLTDRGRMESESLRAVIEGQKKRVMREMGRHDTEQLEFKMDYTQKERIQLQSNRRYWERWLERVDDEIRREPARILDFYKVVSTRIEPIGLAYLWPADA
jgi:superfamily II DNA or RNA helicase